MKNTSGNRKTTKRKLVMLFIIFVLIIILILFFLSKMKATGTITKPKNQATGAFSQEDKFHQGKHFTLEYPGLFDEVPQTMNANSIESLVLYGDKSQQLAITIKNYQNDEDSSIKFRRLHPNTYKESVFLENNLRGILFTKQSDQWEQTLFVERGQIYASISLTDPNGRDRSELFNDIILGFTFVEN